MAEEKAVETEVPVKTAAEEAQEAFTEELTREDNPEEKKVEGKADDQEPLEKAPEEKPEPKPEEKLPEAPAYTDEDKALLTAYDFTEADANPKLVAALKKAERDKHRERNRAEFFGKSNKEMSNKLKAFARSEATSIDAVKERIKARLAKIPKDKLSEHTRNLLDDPAYLEAQAAIEVARMTEEAPDVDAAPAPDKVNREELQKQAAGVFSEVVKVHPDYEAIYRDPKLYAWLKKQDRAVQSKYFENSSSAHVDLINRYKVYQKAEVAAAALAADQNKGADAFAGHGATGSARRGPEKELSPEDEFARIMDMSDADFKKEDQRVLSGGRK